MLRTRLLVVAFVFGVLASAPSGFLLGHTHAVSHEVRVPVHDKCPQVDNGLTISELVGCLGVPDHTGKDDQGNDLYYYRGGGWVGVFDVDGR